MQSSRNLGKIRWQCRRGMLELDIILTRFFDQYFLTLSDQEQEAFIQLLKRQDPELYTWLLEHTMPENESDKMIVTKIRENLSIA